MKSVFEYLDYRTFLKDYYEEQKERHDRSLRDVSMVTMNIRQVDFEEIRIRNNDISKDRVKLEFMNQKAYDELLQFAVE